MGWKCPSFRRNSSSDLKREENLVELRPWCYIFNLVGYVLQYLDNLKAMNKLVQYSIITDDEIHLKIGGDHGGGTNKPENTVIFSFTEAKEYKVNLTLCLERFKAHRTI